MTRWFWIRHARTNPQDSNRGDPGCVIDIPLSPSFPDDAYWLSSPLRRARETASAFGINNPEIVEEFAEQNFGEWATKKWDDIANEQPSTYRAYWQDPVRNAPPSGESFLQMYDRVKNAIDRYNTRFPDRTIVVFAHAGPIRAALAFALGFDQLGKALHFEIPFLSLQRIDFLAKSQWVVHVGRDIGP